MVLSLSLQLSNIDADGEVDVSLLSSKSIIDGVPLVQLKIPHSAGSTAVQCHSISLPTNVTDVHVIVRVQVRPSISWQICPIWDCFCPLSTF